MTFEQIRTAFGSVDADVQPANSPFSVYLTLDELVPPMEVASRLNICVSQVDRMDSTSTNYCIHDIL